MKVVIALSDPWEMGEVLGWPRIAGTVRHSDADCWLVEIDQPFDYANTEYRFIVMRARHMGNPLSNAVSAEIPCNMTRTTAERASSEAPCDLSWRRGGHAMIGTVEALAVPKTNAADAASPRR